VSAFRAKARLGHSDEQERVAYLEKKIRTKDEVPAELMAEHAALKKNLGNSHPGLGSPRFLLQDWSQQAIIAFRLKNVLKGYRRLTFMMRDADRF
jgi:hypothetical protein